MLVDAWYDAYLGVVVLFRVIDGVVKKGMRIKLMQTGADYNVDTLGVLRPKRQEVAELGPGEIGVLTASIKEVADARVGDTITEYRRETKSAARLQAGAAGGVLRPLPGRRGQFRRSARGDVEAAPQRRQLLVRDGDQRRARLRLPLRLPRALHLEIIQERLTREFGLDLIATAPSSSTACT
jgi:GTP-binding protein LepA